jgi:hypothetical protein
LVNGVPDTKHLAQLLRMDPYFGIGGALCSKWYDQSGNGRDATQTGANKPGIWRINGKVYVGSGGVLTTNTQAMQTAQWFDVPSSVALNSNSFSLFAVTTPATTSNATSSVSKFNTIFDTSSASSNGLLWAQVGTAFGGPSGFIIDLTTSISAGNSPPNLGIQRSVVSAFGTEMASEFWVNDVSATGKALPNTGYLGGRLLCNGSASGLFPQPFTGRLQAFMATGTKLSTTQKTAIRNALYRWGNVRSAAQGTTAKTNIVVDGASFDNGQGCDPSGLYGSQNGGGYGWVEMLKDALDERAIQWNLVAASGATIADRTAKYAAITAPCFNPSAAKNILMGPNSAFGNSINSSIGGRTGAQTYDDFQAWLTTVRTQSWNHILCVLLSDGGAGEFFAYNQLMKANAASNNIILVDMSRRKPWSGPPLTNSFDGHPGIGGALSIKEAVHLKLEPLL